MKKHSNSAFITIEASLVLFIFVISYFIVNTVALSIMTESITKKALYETAFDLSSYAVIVDRLNSTDDLETHGISFDNYKKIILNELDEDTNLSNIFDSLKKQISNDVQNFVNKEVYKQIVKNIFANKIKNINGSNNGNIGLLESVSDVKISDVRLFEDGNKISIKINYPINLDKFNIFNFKNNVTQYAEIDTWINRYSKITDSIWHKSNFERGRYFAERLRNGDEIAIKRGIGLDLYNPETNTISQVFSLNIFDKSYSENKTIKDNFYKQLDIYYKEMNANLIKVKNKIITNNGETINLSNPNLKLVIVMPNEAEGLLFDNTRLQAIGNIEFKFMEDALID